MKFFLTVLPNLAIDTNNVLCTFKFTPRNTESRLSFKYNCNYRFSGLPPGGNDHCRTHADVYQGGVLKYSSAIIYQYWVGTVGGGTRSGTVMPLNWTVRNGVLGSTIITVVIYFDNTTDNPMVVQDNDSAWFECTEIRGF